MELTTIRELYRNTDAFLDKEVTVGGWVRSIRDSSRRLGAQHPGFQKLWVSGTA